MKSLLFRLAAVLLSLLPLAAVEGVLRGVGWGRPTDYDDPYVGFSAIHPLFVLNEHAAGEAGGRYEIAPSRLEHFCPESFAAEKPADEFRIFVLGGSTVQGRPWTIETSFSAWLELSLNAADPSRRWEVVNCGGVSYATYRLAPILEEVLRYKPDLILFCEGHNEFLEDRSYSHLRSAPAALAWPGRQIARLRTYCLLRELTLRLIGPTTGKATGASDGRPLLGPECYARLDWQGGVDEYHRDPAWQRDVIEHFAFNIERIARLAQRAQTPLVFISPVANLHWPPFKPEHAAELTLERQQAFQALMEQAGARFGRDPAGAIDRFQRAIALDDQHAGAHYQLGLCYYELGRYAEAEAALRRAKELDVCPLRMLEEMKQRLHGAAAATGTPLVDAAALIAARSRSGFPDQQWLIDHVHPTVEGNQLLAEGIFEKLVELRLVRPRPNWAVERERAYAAHLAELPPLYFERGRQRLESEQGWARGLVKRPKVRPAPPSAEREPE